MASVCAMGGTVVNENLVVSASLSEAIPGQTVELTASGVDDEDAAGVEFQWSADSVLWSTAAKPAENSLQASFTFPGQSYYIGNTTVWVRLVFHAVSGDDELSPCQLIKVSGEKPEAVCATSDAPLLKIANAEPGPKTMTVAKVFGEVGLPQLTLGVPVYKYEYQIDGETVLPGSELAAGDYAIDVKVYYAEGEYSTCTQNVKIENAEELVDCPKGEGENIIHLKTLIYTSDCKLKSPAVHEALLSYFTDTLHLDVSNWQLKIPNEEGNEQLDNWSYSDGGATYTYYFVSRENKNKKTSTCKFFLQRKEIKTALQDFVVKKNGKNITEMPVFEFEQSVSATEAYNALMEDSPVVTFCNGNTEKGYLKLADFEPEKQFNSSNASIDSPKEVFWYFDGVKNPLSQQFYVKQSAFECPDDVPVATLTTAGSECPRGSDVEAYVAAHKEDFVKINSPEAEFPQLSVGSLPAVLGDDYQNRYFLYYIGEDKAMHCRLQLKIETTEVPDCGRNVSLTFADSAAIAVADAEKELMKNEMYHFSGCIKADEPAIVWDNAAVDSVTFALTHQAGDCSVVPYQLTYRLVHAKDVDNTLATCTATVVVNVNEIVCPAETVRLTATNEKCSFSASDVMAKIEEDGLIESLCGGEVETEVENYEPGVSISFAVRAGSSEGHCTVPVAIADNVEPVCPGAAEAVLVFLADEDACGVTAESVETELTAMHPLLTDGCGDAIEYAEGIYRHTDLQDSYEPGIYTVKWFAKGSNGKENAEGCEQKINVRDTRPLCR